jgi:hypothetical protein
MPRALDMYIQMAKQTAWPGTSLIRNNMRGEVGHAMPTHGHSQRPSHDMASYWAGPRHQVAQKASNRQPITPWPCCICCRLSILLRSPDTIGTAPSALQPHTPCAWRWCRWYLVSGSEK